MAEDTETYIVIPLSDVGKYLQAGERHNLKALCKSISDGRFLDFREPLDCVVAEKGSPEYDLIKKD